MRCLKSNYDLRMVRSRPRSFSRKRFVCSGLAEANTVTWLMIWFTISGNDCSKASRVLPVKTTCGCCLASLPSLTGPTPLDSIIDRDLILKRWVSCCYQSQEGLQQIAMEDGASRSKGFLFWLLVPCWKWFRLSELDGQLPLTHVLQFKTNMLKQIKCKSCNDSFTWNHEKMSICRT